MMLNIRLRRIPNPCFMRLSMTIHHPGGNTPAYPEIATASVTGPEDTGSALRYTFNRAIGTKG
jgi:hypothetical protein